MGWFGFERVDYNLPELQDVYQFWNHLLWNSISQARLNFMGSKLYRRCKWMFFVLQKHQEILMNSFWAINVLVKRLRNSKWNKVHKKWQILTICARMHSRKNIILTHIHVVCMQQKIKQFGLSILEKSNFLLKKSQITDFFLTKNVISQKLLVQIA